MLYNVGDKCQDYITAEQIEKCDPEDSFADQLQARRGIVGSGDTTGESGHCYYTLELV